tara:strand:+ start:221 stop:556 length:336 start_codon:yes stop_codon:yes gene_type:complete
MKDNKLISEFMGAVGTPKYNPTEWDVYLTGCLDVDSDDENAKHFYTTDEMKYHTSWDWIIPVVREVLTIVNINLINYCVDELKFCVLDNDIDGAFEEVVEFINYLNKTNNN